MNHYRLFISLLFLFVGSCGFHEQSLSRKEVKTQSKDTTERDPIKLLFSSARSGDLEAMKEVISQYKVDLNSHDKEEGLTLLMTSVLYKQYGVIEYLVEQEVDLGLKSVGERIKPAVNIFGYIDKLSKEAPPKLNDQDVEIVTAIIKKETFDVKRLNKLQFDSIDYFNHQLISWLLKKGADPNTLNRKKRTPLIEYMKKNGVKNIPRLDNNGKAVCSESLRREWLSDDFEKVKQVFHSYLRMNDYKPDLVVGSKKRPTSLEKEIKKQIEKKKREDYKEFLQVYNCRVHSSNRQIAEEGDKSDRFFRTCDRLIEELRQQNMKSEKAFCLDAYQACVGSSCCFFDECKR